MAGRPQSEPRLLFSYLDAVSTASTTDVWAVGTYYARWAESARTLGLHWDGSRWEIVPTPNNSPNLPFNAGHFYDVKAISAVDAWAIGTHLDGMASQHGLTAHWDGSQWRMVRRDHVDRDSDLFGVDALPAIRPGRWANPSISTQRGTNDLIYRLGPNGWTEDSPPEGWISRH